MITTQQAIDATYFAIAYHPAIRDLPDEVKRDIAASLKLLSANIDQGCENCRHGPPSFRAQRDPDCCLSCMHWQPYDTRWEPKQVPGQGEL